MGYNIETKDRWITVADLQRALEDEQLRPDDELHPNAVENLSIMRKGEYVGFIDIPFAKVAWLEEDT